MKNKKIGLILLGIIVVLAIIGGKIYVDKQEAIRQERNQAVKEIQEQASKYIIENYAGIEKIEWNGWSVSKGPSSVDTSMRINDNKNGMFSYKAGHSKWIENYTDKKFEVSSYLEDDLTQEVMAKELRNQGVEKSKDGSLEAEVIYNWEESK